MSNPLAKLLDHRPVDGGGIIRLPARDQIAIDNGFLIHPVGASID